SRVSRAARIGAEREVFRHRHRTEQMAVLRHCRDTLFDNAVGRKADELHAAEPDRAGGWLDETRHGVEERRLAGAVRAEDRNRLAALHANRDIVQRTMAAVPMVEAV